ncbi:Glucosamine-phosphate N-acetyltransferase-like protein [Allomyces javanicus]|nr:Glucosamine-phosphate N-acetyltransferase-like protein [Allomyces javanicus]KAJ3366760.1 Glucosamine-phosphate N-acetyltransferase-like protein [Allomyces javanicus]KAJ3372904.1 Glucosamine-phosphate N-acetyltransferase-like protein [Allomyces arbusculus]
MATPLFNPDLIDRAVNDHLPAGFLLRPLEITDYDKGFLTALSHLTVVGEIDKAAFVDRFAYLKAHAHEYFTIVIEDLKTQRIAAAGTVLVERKFIRNLGLVGHIEDIVVHENYRGLQFGRYIIDALKSIGKNVGCYKIILDCSEKNVPFYVKCGFERKEVEMVWYIPKAKL